MRQNFISLNTEENFAQIGLMQWRYSSSSAGHLALGSSHLSLDGASGILLLIPGQPVNKDRQSRPISPRKTKDAFPESARGERLEDRSHWCHLVMGFALLLRIPSTVFSFFFLLLLPVDLLILLHLVIGTF